MPDNCYLYYSGATDKTGQALADALEIQGGRNKPKTAKRIVIGWGAKTKDKVNLGKAAVLNHPDKIRDNRNKFKALEIMVKAGVAVAPFVTSELAMAEIKKKTGKIALPVIGRTNYHQGGANFWTCLTPTHVSEAVKDLGALGKKGYFQEYIDVKEEFRLHVVGDNVIYAQRKVPRSNLKEAHVVDQADKIKRMAEKKNMSIDDATLKFAMEYQGSKISGADRIIRSNTRGWKFSAIKPANVDKNLASEAIKSVKALGLQFGAVDCVLDAAGKAWIIEANTGPGLEGSSFKAYVKAFSDTINEILSPATTKAAKKTKAKKTSPTKKAAGKSSKIDPEKLRMLADMLDEADDDEAQAVNSVAARMFGNG